MSGLSLNIDIQQIFLHAANLVILLGGLYIILYKPVKDFMDKRIEYYKDMDAQADKVMTESLEKKKLYEEKLSNAEAEIADLRNQAAIASKEAADNELNNAKTEAAKIIESAKERAEAESEKIIAEAQVEVANLALNAAKKIVSNEDEYDSFISSVE